MYSAIKIGGKKLYELARARRAGGRAARARAITIHALELLSCAPPDFTLRVHCSKGDVCPHAVPRPRRGARNGRLHGGTPQPGPYSDGWAVPRTFWPPAPESLLLPVDTLFAAHPALTLTPAQEKRCCRNGASFTLRFAPGAIACMPKAAEFLRSRRDPGRAWRPSFLRFERMHMTRPCVLALGFFDGVHIGHGGLLRRTRETADRPRRAAALTFDTSGHARLRTQCAAAEHAGGPRRPHAGILRHR